MSQESFVRLIPHRLKSMRCCSQKLKTKIFSLKFTQHNPLTFGRIYTDVGVKMG
jgi:hypothetical protein